MEHSGSTGFKRLSAELVPQLVKHIEDAFFGESSQRHVFEIAVDVGSGHEGVMITSDDEVKVDMLVLLHELFEGR